MTAEQFAQLIGTLGFPVAVAAFLIYYFVKILTTKLENLIKAVERNTEVTQGLAQTIAIEQVRQAVAQRPIAGGGGMGGGNAGGVRASDP